RTINLIAAGACLGCGIAYTVTQSTTSTDCSAHRTWTRQSRFHTDPMSSPRGQTQATNFNMPLDGDYQPRPRVDQSRLNGFGPNRRQMRERLDGQMVQPSQACVVPEVRNCGGRSISGFSGRCSGGDSPATQRSNSSRATARLRSEISGRFGGSTENSMFSP